MDVMMIVNNYRAVLVGNLLLLLSLVPCNARPNNSIALSRCTQALNALQTLEYEHRRDLDYPDLGIRNSLQGRVVYDFRCADNLLKVCFYFDTQHYMLMYNGSNLLEYDKQKAIMQLSEKRSANNFEGYSFLNHSIYSLKAALPRINDNEAVNKSEADTVYDQQDCVVVRFWLRKEAIATLGTPWPLSEDRDIFYGIVVRKSDFMPVMVYQKNNKNKDLVTITYRQIKMNIIPDTGLFDVNTHKNKYGVQPDTANKKDSILLVQAGSKAMDFSLPAVGFQQPHSLSRQSGNIVLLDFWFRGCGPCVAAIPALNRLHSRFRDRGLTVLGVNISDSEPDIRLFLRKYPIQYKILYNGQAVAKQYGVQLYPTYILINRLGKVIYAGGADEAMLEKLVEKALE
jgi:thiol-disulfide isomerase/thioredoxin